MGPVGKAYAALVAAGELKPDPDQKRAVQALDRLAAELAHDKPGLLAKLFGRRSDPPRGVYLWGGVGRGKSMLMDLAFDHIAGRAQAPGAFRMPSCSKCTSGCARRARARRATRSSPVAEAIAAEARLLAFDEMVVNNAADAMILSRLFTALIDEGVAVVTTSNRPPRDLYKDGLNRELFLPFIELIERRMEVVPFNGPTDYRLDRLQGVDTWLVPNGPEATAALSEPSSA